MTTDTPSDPIEPRDERLRQWHRLFGIALMEVFDGAPWRVELEQELALRSQLLDVAIIEARGEGAVRAPGVDRPRALPRAFQGLLFRDGPRFCLDGRQGARSRSRHWPPALSERVGLRLSCRS